MIQRSAYDTTTEKASRFTAFFVASVAEPNEPLPVNIKVKAINKNGFRIADHTGGDKEGARKTHRPRKGKYLYFIPYFICFVWRLEHRANWLAKC